MKIPSFSFSGCVDPAHLSLSLNCVSLLLAKEVDWLSSPGRTPWSTWCQDDVLLSTRQALFPPALFATANQRTRQETRHFVVKMCYDLSQPRQAENLYQRDVEIPYDTRVGGGGWRGILSTSFGAE